VLKIEKDADTVEGLELKYIIGAQGWERESHAMIENLEKGDYFVYVEMDWNTNTEDHEVCVTCYGASRTFFMRDEKSLFDKNDLLRKAFASKSTQMLEGVSVFDFKDKGAE